jgi:hypothetical protein
MRLLKVILVIIMLAANYTAAQAFDGVCHCPKSAMSGKMMDCCKGQAGKHSCGSCMTCAMAVPAALSVTPSFAVATMPAKPAVLPVSALTQRFLPPDFRPPDFRA